VSGLGNVSGVTRGFGYRIRDTNVHGYNYGTRTTTNSGRLGQTRKRSFELFAGRPSKGGEDCITQPVKGGNGTRGAVVRDNSRNAAYRNVAASPGTPTIYYSSTNVRERQFYLAASRGRNSASTFAARRRPVNSTTTYRRNRCPAFARRTKPSHAYTKRTRRRRARNFTGVHHRWPTCAPRLFA